VTDNRSKIPAMNNARRIFTLVQWKGGVGKCLDGATLLVDPRTGLPTTLRNMVEAETVTHVLTYDAQAERVTPVPIAAKLDSGVKPCVRIVFASGRSVVATSNHPFLMPDGWRPAATLAVGETAALPAAMPHPTQPAPLPPAEVDLLAILLAEGGCTDGTPRFTTADPAILACATAAAATLGMNVRSTGNYGYRLNGTAPVPAPPGYCQCGCGLPTRPAAANRPARGHRHGQPHRYRSKHHPPGIARTLARRHGLEGRLAKHKAMPEAVYRLPAEQLARFLAVFWMCDGYVTDQEPGVTLASEQLIRALQHLLLRFGIQSRVAARTATAGGKAFPAWRLSVYAHSWQLFLDTIPLWGVKRDRLRNVCATARTRPATAAGNVGAPVATATLCSQLRAEAPLGRRPRAPEIPSFAKAARPLGWGKFQYDLLFQRASGTVSRAVCDVFDCADAYQHLGSEGVFWDRIVAIEPAGPRQVYDLAVEPTHCFVANDIIVHNSTLAVHLAAYLGAVLVDLEPWGSATGWWAGRRFSQLWQAAAPRGHSIGAPLLRALSTGRAPRPLRGEAGRPRLVPSHQDLLALVDGGTSGIAHWAWNDRGAPTLMIATATGPQVLATAIASALPTWAADWGSHVVVDTPGGYGPLADGAVGAADVVLVPTSLDPWSIPTLRRFMASYANRVAAGLIIPNRVRDRANDADWAEVLTAPGVIQPPFVQGPQVEESEIVHGALRPLSAGLGSRAPSEARKRAMDQIAAVADRALTLAER
jgi:cellulose biosynthesis protein BcsQ